MTDPQADPVSPIPADHELKVWPEYFAGLVSGAKSFEVRRDDRGFAVGQVLRLREWSADGGYSGRELRARVTYLLRGPAFGVEAGHVVMALVPADPPVARTRIVSAPMNWKLPYFPPLQRIRSSPHHERRTLRSSDCGPRRSARF